MLIVTVTLPTRQDAERIAAALLERRLVADAQFSPVTSRYHWQGQIETAEEIRLDMKTRTQLFDDIADYVTKNHPYEVPQIIATPITRCADPYAGWLHESTGA